MDLSSPDGVTIKIEPGIEDDDGHISPAYMYTPAFVEIEVPNIKQEFREVSESNRTACKKYTNTICEIVGLIMLCITFVSLVSLASLCINCNSCEFL